MSRFKNGAVIRNDKGEFLGTRDGMRTLTWENGTEHAICFKNNKEAEDFLDEWNDNHRRNPRLILNGVKIEESTCACGETSHPIDKNTKTPCECNDFDDEDSVNVTDDMVAIAVKLIKKDESALKELAEKAEEKEELENEIRELQEELDEKKEELEDLQEEIDDLKESINAKLDSVFTQKAKEAVIRELLNA